MTIERGQGCFLSDSDIGPMRQGRLLNSTRKLGTPYLDSQLRVSEEVIRFFNNIFIDQFVVYVVIFISPRLGRVI